MEAKEEFKKKKDSSHHVAQVGLKSFSSAVIATDYDLCYLL